MPEKSDSIPTDEIPLHQAYRIACRFQVTEPIEVADFASKGNIHRQAFLITAGQPGNRREYILQMLNTDVFVRPEAVMDTCVSCIRAQNEALAGGALQDDESWEPVRLIPTREGKAYLKTGDSENPEYWRMMARIGNAESYESLKEIPSQNNRLHIAEEAGKGLALFGRLTGEMNVEGIPVPLSGYRNTGLYYNQMDSILKGCRTPEEAAVWLPSDPIVKRDTEQLFMVHLDPENYASRMEDPQVRQFTAEALDHRIYCLELQRQLASGKLKTVIVHGDTKLENFLFSTITGKVKALVDLDTIMPHTWLSDWGDMVRSLVNIEGEKQKNPGEIEIDMDVFKALAKGFLDASPSLPGHEVEMMVDAARIMALELGVRYLTDYIRGDTYFRLGAGDPEDLNRNRAAVQFLIFRNLGHRASDAKRYIADLYRTCNNNPLSC